VIVDEAHLINPKNDKTMYRRFIEELQAINPTCRVIGLTATPFRLGSGSIVGDDSIFQQIVYNAKTGDLISQGWLCEITNKTAADERWQS
jgi:DNA repair protein RadD